MNKDFHVAWYIIFYKFILGLLELVAGLGIAFFGHQALHWYNIIASQDLSEYPHDLLAYLSVNVIPDIFTHNTFLIIYLIILGAAKIIGSIGLMYKRNWGVDLLVGLTILLLPFQLFNLILNPTIFDCIYIAIGLFIALYLIEFKPKAWISKMLLQWDNLKK